MGASVKVASFAAISVILLQAVHCNQASKDPSAVLKNLDETQQKLNADVSEHISSAIGYIQDTYDKMKRTPEAETMQKDLYSSLSDARLNVREVRTNILNHVCDRVREVEEVTNATTPTPDIAEIMKTPEYKRYLDDGVSKLNKDKNIIMRIANKTVAVHDEKRIKTNQAEEPSFNNLEDWKKYFVYKTEWTHKIHDDALEGLREASNYMLQTLRDAVVAWSGAEENHGHKQKTPSVTAKKVRLVGAALGLNEMLACDE